MNDIRMQNLSLNESKQSAKLRRIKDCNNTSKERLSGVLSESESAKRNFDSSRIKEIRKYFNKLRDRFSNTEIKAIKKKHL